MIAAQLKPYRLHMPTQHSDEQPEFERTASSYSGGGRKHTRVSLCI